MMFVGQHKISARDFVALIAPLIVCSIITYSLVERFSVDNFLATLAIYVAVLSPALFIWWHRMRTKPGDPWKFG